MCLGTREHLEQAAWPKPALAEPFPYTLSPGGMEFLEPAVLGSGSTPERPGPGPGVMRTSGNGSHSPFEKSQGLRN